MRWKTAAITCLCLAALSASAQVHRCKDATGKTVYSDHPCAAGQAGAQIERQRSQADIRREREQAYNAELQKQDRRMTEQERALAQQQRAGKQPRAPLSAQPTEGWQARKDRENAATSASSITNNGGRFDSKAEAARAKERDRRNPDPVVHPTTITHCDNSFCYDNTGAASARIWNDTIISPTGKTCQHSGAAWNCN